MAPQGAALFSVYLPLSTYTPPSHLPPWLSQNAESAVGDDDEEGQEEAAGEAATNSEQVGPGEPGRPLLHRNSSLCSDLQAALLRCAAAPQ